MFRFPSILKRAARLFLRKKILPLLCIMSLPAYAEAQQGSKSWTDYGGGLDNSHYVDLKQIDKTNVSKLSIAWSYPTQDSASYLFNPVVVGDVMYVLARNTSLAALNATTGKEIWVHENLTGIALRGINFWQSKNGKDQRLILQIHHQLQEIDARTGKSILTFGNNGFVDLRQGLRRDPSTMSRIQSNNPGKVFQNLIILGSVTGENYMSPPGDLRAFDVTTGKLVWQFHTLPHPGELGYDTWPKDAWKYIGGVNTWGELSIDDKRGIAYFPVGSGTYDFYGADRKGNNLFGNCILALDARTGKYLWHFQEVHHDLWDYDPTSAPQLITVRHDGKMVDAVAQAGKSSFLYVLDRVTGKPLWPIEERPVPKSDVPGEWASPTQPVPTVPPPFGRQQFRSSDINPYLPADQRAALKARIDVARNEGIFTPPGLKESVEMPGNRGGSNWGMTAANPKDGTVYVVSIDAPALLKLEAAQPTNGGGIVNPFGQTGFSNQFAVSPGQAVYQQNCQMCHGANRTGGGQIPSLVDVTGRLAPDVIEGIVQNGQGQMPSFSNLGTGQIKDLIAFLSGPNGTLPMQPKVSLGGPVVASGGAPAGQTANDKFHLAGNYGIMDGPPYPTDAEAPTERYFTGWNVMYNIIGAPWNTLTSYDLNKGTIKWQIPVGDAPGILTEQRGVIPTSTGLVFLASGDGKVRAFDDQTGKVLWTADLPAGSRGIPAIYEADGREYLVINATSTLTIGDGNPPTPEVANRKLNRAYVAFALPRADTSKH